jgi:hypothetical protein
MSNEPLFAYARINARVMPIDRGEFYEDPLQEAFDANGFGAVTGGGTMQAENGEIAFCGIDIDLLDVERGLPFVAEFLADCGAPKGSLLEFKQDQQDRTLPFGSLEGVALYINGTDLPSQVYETCDINVAYDEIISRLGDRGCILGHWHGPTETALYLYGDSADEMRQLIADFLASYPLCQKSRLVQIA